MRLFLLAYLGLAFILSVCEGYTTKLQDVIDGTEYWFPNLPECIQHCPAVVNTLNKCQGQSGDRKVCVCKAPDLHSYFEGDGPCPDICTPMRDDIKKLFLRSCLDSGVVPLAPAPESHQPTSSPTSSLASAAAMTSTAASQSTVPTLSTLPTPAPSATASDPFAGQPVMLTHPDHWLHRHGKYLVAAGVAVAFIALIIVFVCAWYRRRQHRRGSNDDLEDAILPKPKASPFRWFGIGRKPELTSAQKLDRLFELEFAEPLAPPPLTHAQREDEWLREYGYNFKAQLKDYGKQHKDDRDVDTLLYPSLNTSPASRKVTEGRIIGRLFDNGRPGFSKNRTPGVE